MERLLTLIIVVTISFKQCRYCYTFSALGNFYLSAQMYLFCFFPPILLSERYKSCSPADILYWKIFPLALQLQMYKCDKTDVEVLTASAFIFQRFGQWPNLPFKSLLTLNFEGFIIHASLFYMLFSFSFTSKS